MAPALGYTGEVLDPRPTLDPLDPWHITRDCVGPYDFAARRVGLFWRAAGRDARGVDTWGVAYGEGVPGSDSGRKRKGPWRDPGWARPTGPKRGPKRRRKLTDRKGLKKRHKERREATELGAELAAARVGWPAELGTEQDLRRWQEQRATWASQAVAMGMQGWEKGLIVTALAQVKQEVVA